jgi:hypothetical protein
MNRYWKGDYPYRFGPPVEEDNLRDRFQELMEVKRMMADEEILIRAKMEKEKPKEAKPEKKDGWNPVLLYILLGLSSPFIGLVMSAFYIKMYVIVGEMVKGIK